MKLENVSLIAAGSIFFISLAGIVIYRRHWEETHPQCLAETICLPRQYVGKMETSSEKMILVCQSADGTLLASPVKEECIYVQPEKALFGGKW